MCIKKKTFLKLLEMYPRTENSLREFSLERRKHFIKEMKKLDKQSPNVLQALSKQMRNQFNSRIQNHLTQMMMGRGI